ncbi:hypothetical protein BDB01DRAFT_795194 [Pilobolus umbonatus]|nr:hypothetical protein BDB01DRAFT_795194 [Pilobolus umbonatus]
MQDTFDMFQTMTTTPRSFPVMELVDVKGNKVDVSYLASHYHLILITLTNVDCPGCPQLLKILNMYGLNNDIQYPDTLLGQQHTLSVAKQKFFRLLLKQDAYFIVICPGSNARVTMLQENVPFNDYPFIGGDQAIAIAKALKIYISQDELMPALWDISSTLSVDSIYIGRGPDQYFHRFLLERLMRERYDWELRGITSIKEGHHIISQLKRKQLKCQQGNLVTSISFIQPTKTEEVDPIYRSGCQSILDHLPIEMIEYIFSYLSDIHSLVKPARTCRLFYSVICNVLVSRIRNQISHLILALPQNKGNFMFDKSELVDENLDRWRGAEEGIPYRELQRRVIALQNLLMETGEWTKQWSPRRMRILSRMNTINI